MKILMIGDLHIRMTAPRSRIDNFKNTLQHKFNLLRNIVIDNDIELVLTTGDVFDRAKVTNETLLLARELISQLKVPVKTIIGNHDMISNSLENHERSSLAILDELTDNLEILDSCNRFPSLSNPDVLVIPKHYGEDNFTHDITLDKFKMLVTHSMITEKETMFDSISVEEVAKNSNYDFVLTGHNHLKFYHENHGTVVYNPGALLRLTSKKEDREREVEVGIFDTKTKKLERKLLGAAPMDLVFNIELEEEKEEVLSDKFLEFLESATGSVQDPITIAENIFKNKSYDEDVVKEVNSLLK